MLRKCKLRSLMILLTIAVSLLAVANAFAGATTYQYDELDRLKNVYYDGVLSIVYDYDEIGNRTQMTTPPVADFSASSVTGYFPLTVNFTDLSVGIPATWYWDFGDGFTSTDKNPSHTYNSQGNYTVSLIVTNFVGTNTQTKTSYITVQAGTTYKVKIASATPTYYNSLQSAYKAAADGDTIQCQAVELTENLNFCVNKTVTLIGGYNPEFTATSGVTTVHGAMNTTAGAVSAKSFDLKY